MITEIVFFGKILNERFVSNIRIISITSYYYWKFGVRAIFSGEVRRAFSLFVKYFPKFV